MGYFKHEAVIVVLEDWDKAGHEAIAAFASDMPEEYRKYLLGPVVGINGVTTYVLVPDGSKEGWNDSNQMNEWRERFIAAANQAEYPGIVHLQMDGDDRKTIIHYTTDEEAFVLDGAVKGKPEE